MSYKVSNVCGECFSFGWVEIDKENKKIKRSLTSENWAVLELLEPEWAKTLFEKKLLPNFKQVSSKEKAIVPEQDLKPENRGKSVEVIWVEVDYLEHLVYHSEFTSLQKKMALKALFELILILEKNGWYIRCPHFGNITFAPEPMMFDIGDIRKNDDSGEMIGNYVSVFSTLPLESMANLIGYDKLVSHLNKFIPGSPTDNCNFIKQALDIIGKLEVKSESNYWDNYNAIAHIPSKDDLHAFENFQPTKSNSIAQILKELRPKTVVDVGCSEGYYSFMAEAFGANSVIGLDYSEKAVDTAVQISMDRGSVCKFAHCDLTLISRELSNRMYSDLSIGAAIMHHLFKAGLSFERIANLFASLGENCMIEYIAPFDMHQLNKEKANHTIEHFKRAFHRYWKKIELLPTIPMGSEKYNEWYQKWLLQNPGATLADMPRVWLKCSERVIHEGHKVSIGLGVRNEEKYIRKTIESLLKQKFADFELIISDNASTDKTYDICEELAQRDERIKLYRNKKDLGILNFIKLVNYAVGEYFMLAGGHDLWEPEFIYKCIAELENNPNLVLCHTKCAEIDPTDKIVRIMPDTIDTRNLSYEERFPKIWMLKTGVPIYGLIRLDVLRGINLQRRVLGGDIVMLGELSIYGEIAFIDQLLSYQRSHREPESSNDSVRRTLKALNPDQYKNKFQTAWLDLLREHMEVLNKQNLTELSENFLLEKLVESFKLNYGELPENEVKSLVESYIKYFEESSKKQIDTHLIRKAQIALEYINAGLLLYPDFENLHKAFSICTSVINNYHPKLSRGIKIAGQDMKEKDLTQIDSVSEFAKQLNRVIKEYKPKKLMETGTYLGMGTTSVVTSALKENGLEDSQFFSIEVKLENHLTAKKNLTEKGLINYVTLLNGLSMPRKALPTIEEIERATVKEVEFEGIYIDHQESERARLYYNETNYDDVEEDLIGKCLITFENKPDFVLLDSGGHMGNVEFNYLIERLEKECIVALDDVNHIKHRKSYKQIQNDSRFELITSSDEKFGFCIAKFTPAKDKILPVQPPIKIHPKKILYIRTDAVGDNVLASVILKGIKEKFPKADITVICNALVADLYKYSPYIKNVIGFNRSKFENDDEYKGRFLANLKAQKYDLAINSIYSSDQVVDIILFTAGAKQTIRIDGNGENFVQSWQWVNSANARATHVIRTGAGWRSEMNRHMDFLHGLGVNAKDFKPEMWLGKEDEEFAEKIFSDNGLTPEKTIVLFAGAKFDLRVYAHYGKALSRLCKENGYSVIALGSSNDEKINQDNLDEIDSKTINLSGKTTLRQTAAIIKKCRLAVGAETGNAHIACAVGTPNVIIIGGGHFGRFMPYSGLTSLVTLPMDCYGCNWVCKYERTHCVKDIDTAVLSKAIEDVLMNTSQNPKIFFNELPDDKSRKLFGRMLSRFISPDKVELKEVKGNQNSTYCKTILYLAEEAIEANQPDKAKKLLHNILSFDPENVDALNNFAVAEIIAENWETALNILLKVIKIDPKNDVALGNLQFLNEKFVSGNELSKDSVNQKNQVLPVQEDTVPSTSEIKLSAIVSVYNAERFMRGCMEDLTAQTIYKRGEMEIIIVETGSQQNEKIIIDEYVKNYPNINYIRIPERETVYQAWNRGVRAARGKYLTNANADDRHRANGLEMLVDLLEKNPDKVLAYGNSVISEVENDTFENCKVLGYLNWPDFDKIEMLEKCYIGPHPVWRKSLHDEFGSFDEGYQSSADYEFWLRAAQKYEFIHLNESVGVYYWNDSSVSRHGNLPIIETNEIKKKYRQSYLIQEPEKILPIESILGWEIFRGTKSINSIEHKLRINCPNCSHEFEYHSIQEFKKIPGQADFNCPKCKQNFIFTEDAFSDYLKTKYDNLKSTGVASKNKKPRVAYFLKDAHIITGGAKIALKHIYWLMKLGVEVVVYSFEPEPRWIDFKINFKRLKSFDELDEKEFNQIIVFSIFEVPAIIQKVHPSRVLLFCQGYEGYHYGEYFEDVRSNKFMFDEMHSLPIGSIVISKHLIDLFDNRFMKSSYYVPNSIDHSIFNPSVPLKSRDKSIVFIGNPFHFLKGFPFLVNTLKIIQSSKYKIEDLKLKIIMGFTPPDKKEMEKNLEKNVGIKVEIMTNLTSNEVSAILQNSSILICSSVYEGFSLPLLEAMASGTPVITTYNMGAESFCIDGKNSRIINYGDKETLAKIIIEIMQNSDSVYPLVAEGVKTSYEYNEISSFNSLVNVFESILEKKFDQSVVDKILGKISAPKELSDGELKNILIPSEEIHEKSAEDLVSIIIPTYNKSEYVVEAVKSIEKSTKSPYEIIIVDDGSTEDLFTPFKENKKITVIRNEVNSGFPKSVNRGLQESSGKYILLVNNDTVCTKGSIDRMIEIAELNEKVGLVGVISNEASGPQWDKKAKYTTMNQMHAYANRLRLKNKGKHYIFPRIAFLFTLIKREVIDKIGGLDERFSPGYYEDDDFCLRAQLGGFKGIIAPDIFIHHHGSVSFSAMGEERRIKLSDINRQKFKEKWGGTTEEVWLEGVEIKIRSIKYSINKDDFKKHFERAVQHAEDNEIKLADVEIEKAISSYPESAKKGYEEIKFCDVLNLAGKIAFFNQDYEKAKMYYEEELKTEPESSTACQGLGEVFYALEMLEEAKTMFEWAVKNDHNNFEAQKKLEMINEKLGYDKSDNKLIDYDPAEIIQHAEALIEKEEYEQAKQILTELLDKAPDYIDALNDLAVINIVENKFMDALQLINKVLSIDPENEIALGNFQYINQQNE